MPQPRLEFLRYVITISFGLGADLTIARIAFAFGAHLEVAASIGFAVGALFNYVVLNIWAFAGPKIDLSSTRIPRYLVALVASMAVRASAVWILYLAAPESTPPMVILCTAVIASFVVNFTLSKYWVFRSAS